ncbi:MAG: tetratricopeptide repeat protein [Polyangiaceae bacterium]
MNKRKLFSPIVALGLGYAFVASFGCSSAQTNGTGAAGGGNQLKPEVQKAYTEGLDALKMHDKANDWTAETCDATAKSFLDANDKNGSFLPTAVYNAGVSYQRCNDREKAAEQYKTVLEKDPTFHRARVQLALFAFADSKETAIEPAIKEMEQAVQDSKFQNTEALVNLARLQMKRANATDFDEAKKNLQRALAVDDAYMPAFNQLAIYYLTTAKKQAGAKTGTMVKAGEKAGKVNAQALDLALLVTTQAIRKNANFAPIYNTAGLIFGEQGNLNQAVSSFQTARKLDPAFFEAHMNFAAVNLGFRGFQQAEEAYRAAIKVRPDDYDAHLGLALALRGEIDNVNFDAKLKEAEGEIEAAKKIDPQRPEAYFNQAILTEQFKAKSGDSNSNASLQTAITLYEGFIERAKGKPEFASAVDDVSAVATKPDQQCLGKKAKEDHDCKKGRIQNVKETIAFNNETEAMRKKAEEEEKQRKAMEEAGTPAEQPK